MSIRAVLIAIAATFSPQASVLAQNNLTLTSLLEKHGKDIANGKAPKIAFIAPSVMAPDSEELVAIDAPVPQNGETFANGRILLRCVDARGLPTPARKPGEKGPKFYTVKASLADVQIVPDTGAYESNALAQFSATIENCEIADRTVTAEKAIAERNIALMNTKALYPGPTFACPDLSKCNPLAQVIVAESQSAQRLGLTDIALVQPYQILRHAKPDGQKALRDDAARFAQSVEKTCKLPKKFQPDEAHGNLAGTERFAPCIKDAYDKQRLTWAETVRGMGVAEASEEMARAAHEHYFLQLLLVYHGFLPANSKVDGSYGSGTRAAIVAVQKEAKLPETGYMANASADYLLKREDNNR